MLTSWGSTRGRNFCQARAFSLWNPQHVQPHLCLHKPVCTVFLIHWAASQSFYNQVQSFANCYQLRFGTKTEAWIRIWHTYWLNAALCTLKICLAVLELACTVTLLLMRAKLTGRVCNWGNARWLRLMLMLFKVIQTTLTDWKCIPIIACWIALLTSVAESVQIWEEASQRSSTCVSLLQSQWRRHRHLGTMQVCPSISHSAFYLNRCTFVAFSRSPTGWHEGIVHAAHLHSYLHLHHRGLAMLENEVFPIIQVSEKPPATCFQFDWRFDSWLEIWFSLYSYKVKSANLAIVYCISPCSRNHSTITSARAISDENCSLFLSKQTLIKLRQAEQLLNLILFVGRFPRQSDSTCYVSFQLEPRVGRRAFHHSKWYVTILL